MYELLKSIGYSIEDDHKLIGYVKFDSMRDAIYDFFDNRKTIADDTLVFYYSGHGRPISDGNVCLTSSETDYYNPRRRGFSSYELTNLIQESVSSRVVEILDCCYSGSAKINIKGSEEDAAKLASDAIEKNAISLQQQLQQGEGKYLFASSQSTEESFGLVQKGHSLFTYYMLEGLKPNKESVDKNGYVTPFTLGNYVDKTIRNLPPDRRPRQKPILKIESSGEVILAYYRQFAKTKDEVIEPKKLLYGLFETYESIKSYPLPDEMWEDIIYGIKDRRFVPFLGPETAFFSGSLGLLHLSNRAIIEEIINESDYPLEDLLKGEILENGYLLSGSSLLSKIADYEQINSRNIRIRRKISRYFRQKDFPNFSLDEFKYTPYSFLARLGFPLYITTNYDLLMEKALKDCGKEPVTGYCIWNERLKVSVKEGLKENFREFDDSLVFNKEYNPSIAKPLVYHLNGTIDEEASMVLNSKDYYDFLLYISREGDDVLPTIIRKSLAMDYSLFIGIPFEDIRFQYIFNTIFSFRPRFRDIETRGIAIRIPLDSSNETQTKNQRDRESLLNDEYGIRTYLGKTSDFFKELEKRLYNTR